MSEPKFKSLYLLCFISLISATTSDDTQILLNLKTALKYSNTEVFNSWNSKSSACNFTGVTCNSDGSVSEIELSNQGLAGPVPFDSLCSLASLRKLSLGFNSLYGNVSGDLNRCVNLQYLDLGSNSFAGSMPEISGLSQLQHLYLNGSGFSGAFPWKSLTNMTGLVSLSLGDNPFDATPFPAEIVGLTRLNWLYLSNCSIEGQIPPGIGNLVELRNLELSDNNINGSIPAEITKLANLWQLELYNNTLTGKIPSGFGNLTNLENFDASMNYLEGDLSELRLSTNLVTLQLFTNKLAGDIPAEFGEFRRLVNLSLYQNQLTGSLPEKLGSWVDFNFIDLSENLLTGPIPSDMCKKGTMQELLLLQNKLTGPIPANYGNCKSLRRFRVSNNSLSGNVPAGLWGLPDLNIIDIAMNQIEGPITADIGNANSLAQLFVANNKLSGELPDEVTKISSLIAIDLSNNRFSGKIPSKIGDLTQLGSLQLHDNEFSGSIPASLGTCNSLSDLNLARNSLSSKIPASLGSLPNLNSLNLSSNELSGKIPESLASLRLSLLDLSQNRLSGLVPESLTVEAYNGSFAGNPGLCSLKVNSFRRCPVGTKDVRTLTVCIVLASVIVLVSIGCFLRLKKGQKSRDRSLREESWDVKSFHVLSFTEDEILDSIKQENQIGKGGSGNVYRVSLSNGADLAVKHIWNTDTGGRKMTKTTTPMLRGGGGSRKSSEFDAEVETLSSIRHVNVVKLFCSITSEDSSLLVYEYLPNGSLWDRLHSSQKMLLDWENRYEIALGSAKGLEYLHHGCERPVIHRDVKSSNILLDEFLKPRIADFGLAKIVQANSGKDSTHVIAGTHGYIAPEYGYTYKVNEKSDVYSFGVVLMELVTGKRPTMEAEYGENKDIVSWVCSKLSNKDSVMSMVDSRIPEALKEDAIKVLRIAILCTARHPALRPTMRSVVHMLEEAEPCRLVNIVITKDGAANKIQVTESAKQLP